MAKRYHHSKKMARKHEEKGMEHYLRGPVKKHHSHNADKFNDEHHRDQDQKSGDMDFNPRPAMRANANEFYAGMPARKRQELEDSGMIREDDRAIANLPQYVKIMPYPMHRDYLEEGLDDTIRGVDMQMDYDDEQRQNHFYPKKV